MNHPIYPPCNGINHPLGNHPDSVLFSNHMLEEFGIDNARRDFGTFLEVFSAFLDEHLEVARAVRLSDVEDDKSDQHRTADGRWEQNVDWTSRSVLKLLTDPNLTSAQVAEALGCESSGVRDRRRALGIDVTALRSRNDKLARWASKDAHPAERRCEFCETPIAPERLDPTIPGPLPRFCDNRCMKRAWRRSRKGT